MINLVIRGLDVIGRASGSLEVLDSGPGKCDLVVDGLCSAARGLAVQSVTAHPANADNDTEW